MKILGIDPGSTLIGFGLIEESGSELKVLDYGLIKIKAKEFKEKIYEINKELDGLIKKTSPDLVGLEQIFFAKNKKTAIEVAQARGVIAACVLKQQISLLEITPNEVKSFVAGYGAADKEAVAKMTAAILKMEKIKEDNTADALAIAIATGIKAKQL
ncbi:MAG: crossover junction endodeoxyribonuclease RuvC [bacterium]|nr:crossover junction endodeoxyribonuclease RuvC [bacterium]